jgi:hypothetical protein
MPDTEAIADLFFDIRQCLDSVKGLLDRKPLHKKDKERAQRILPDAQSYLQELQGPSGRQVCGRGQSHVVDGH